MSYPTLAEQIADKCMHFTGTMTKVCRAGVRYADVEVRHDPVEYKSSDGHPYTSTRSLPCNHRLNHCGAVCALAQFPTPEQFAAQVEESHRSVRQIFDARAAIVAKISESGEQRGTVPCPVCKGELRYRRAESDGHIWGQCQTEGCVSWME